MCWRGILADVTKGWKRDLHEAGDNKDEINGVSGLITSKEGERKREKKKRKQKWRVPRDCQLAREEPAPCSTARSRGPPTTTPTPPTPSGSFISRVSQNREGAKYTGELPPTTTATTLATDGADVFSALITDLTSAVSSETLIYQQARRARLVLLAGWRLMSSNNAENLI